MTLKSQMTSDVSAVFLDTDEMAESWTQWPQGVESNAATVTVVPEIPVSEPAERRLDRGDEQRIEIEIWLASSVTVHVDDVWLDENSNRYDATALHPIEKGMRRVTVVRIDKQHTSRPGAGVLL